MARARALLVLLVLLPVFGCAAARKDTYGAFYAHQPRSIVIVPVMNESPEINAPSVFMSTVSAPLAERGYYVFPVYLVDALLRDLGLPEAGLVHQLPVGRFYDLFGADAVLFVTIRDWSTKYIVLTSTVTVEMEYVLRDTRSGVQLWARSQRVAHSSGGSNLIDAAVQAAVNALLTDYRPLAREANFAVFASPGGGLPAGPYHPEYGQDRDRF
ncbi:MAG: DUF799 family lipoprotein [Deltaproteobacteria bacterium]|nr:DUF799 family lipoprotein [Deltaproteobacteria bacterium]